LESSSASIENINGTAQSEYHNENVESTEGTKRTQFIWLPLRLKKVETVSLKFNHEFYFSLSLQPPWALASIFSFMIISQTVGLLGRVISLSKGLYLNTGQHKYRINTYTYQTSMPCVGFEPTIPASERAKTVHALHCSATVTGLTMNVLEYLHWLRRFA
jgi:hypothetical protein